MIKYTRRGKALTYAHDAAEVTALITPAAYEGTTGYRYEVRQFGRVLDEGTWLTQGVAKAKANQWIAVAVEAATGEAL